MTIPNEVRAFATKIIIPALTAISIKIAIAFRTKPMSKLNVVISIVSGIGSAYLFSGPAMEYFSDQWLPVGIAMITISGEKIAYYVIHRLNVEQLIDIIFKHR